MTAAALLEARRVAKTYLRGAEEVHAVDGLSLTLWRGELVGLVGPSGSGKTTLLNLMAGWEKPDAGDLVWLSGQGDSSPDRLSWSDLALVPQTLGLLDELSVGENIELPLRLGSRPSVGATRTDELLDGLGLSQLQERMPSEVSLGEQQRAAVARALVGAPRLLLADEPTGHQDADWATGVFRVLRASCDRGTTCLVATHNEEVFKFFDRILTMADGRLHDGPP